MEVSQDTAGLREAAGAWFEYLARRDAAGAHRDLVEAPQVSPPHLAWVRFLLGLKATLALAPQLGRKLRADVAEGLLAIEDARVEFQRQHRACPKCGKLMPVLAKMCTCGQKF